MDSINGKRTLLVDDVDINRVIAIEMLSNIGLKIEEAGDGSVRVKMLEGDKPKYSNV